MSVIAPEQLPEPRRTDRRAGRELCTISLEVEVVTPILGGATQTRALDEVDVIRVPTVRGHLRFWWRALCGLESKELYERESELWGRAATDDAGSPARSAVQICTEVHRPHGEIDKDPINAYGSRKTVGAYALWPARATKQEPTAPRRSPGTRFRLVVVAPKEHEAELRNVIRAWLLFGGYGSRTRRGLGSFQVVNDARAWLPAKPTREAFAACFGRDIFAAPIGAGDTPRLAGAALRVGAPGRRAIDAWTTALDWLNEFRQGTVGASPARKPDPSRGNRPSISNWPEADKLRRLTGKTKAHPPRHDATPAWPRAGFGLPIIGQFQRTARDNSRVPLDEPDDFEVRWRATGPKHDRAELPDGDRLASPLIVKALPLADQTFVPCALWLHRAFPKGEVVVRLRRAQSKEGGAVRELAGSAAPFDRFRAPGDTPQFAALADKTSLRAAFLDWLVKQHKTMVVVP